MPAPIDLTGCYKPSGFAAIYVIEANKILNVVRGTLTGEQQSVKDFTLAAPTDKFTPIQLNGNHVEVKKDAVGDNTGKASATVTITTKQILNFTDEGIEALVQLYKNCGLALVCFSSSGQVVYVGPAGVDDADKVFLGNIPTYCSADAGTTGASATDNQSGSITFTRMNELTDSVFRPLAPSLVANFVANFV